MWIDFERGEDGVWRMPKGDWFYRPTRLGPCPFDLTAYAASAILWALLLSPVLIPLARGLK